MSCLCVTWGILLPMLTPSHSIQCSVDNGVHAIFSLCTCIEGFGIEMWAEVTALQQRDVSPLRLLFLPPFLVTVENICIFMRHGECQRTLSHGLFFVPLKAFGEGEGINSLMKLMSYNPIVLLT